MLAAGIAQYLAKLVAACAAGGEEGWRHDAAASDSRRFVRRVAVPGRPLGRPLVAQRRTTPALRAELIALWMEHFAPRARFHALVVEDRGQWVAALPLVGRRVAGILPAGATVGNPWSSLRRPALGRRAGRPTLAVGDALVEAMARLPWQLLWLEGAALDCAAMAGIAAKPWPAPAPPPSAAGDGSPDDCRSITVAGLPVALVEQASPQPRPRVRSPGRPRRGDAGRVSDRLRPHEVEGPLARGPGSRRRRLEGGGGHFRAANARRVRLLPPPSPATGRSGTNWPWPCSAAAGGRSPSATVWRPRGSSTPGRSATTPARPIAVPANCSSTGSSSGCTPTGIRGPGLRRAAQRRPGPLASRHVPGRPADGRAAALAGGPGVAGLRALPPAAPGCGSPLPPRATTNTVSRRDTRRADP